MEQSEVLQNIRDHLGEGTLVVIGSGLSVAEGLPSMGQLAQGLVGDNPVRHDAEDPGWTEVVNRLAAGASLETAMAKLVLDKATEDFIIRTTSRLVGNAERAVVGRVLAGEHTLPLTGLFRHLFKAARQFHCITSNYDRLVELAASECGIGVDDGFVGNLIGRYDAHRSAQQHRQYRVARGRLETTQDHTLRLYKPHGSLDWTMHGDNPTRVTILAPEMPLIITPGTGKYRESLRPIFEKHRTAGNQAIEQARRLLFIGYGFNDDHLQEFLCPGGRLLKPTVILARELTDNAQKVIAASSGVSVLAVSAEPNDRQKALVKSDSGDSCVFLSPIWNLADFNKEVI